MRIAILALAAAAAGLAVQARFGFLDLPFALVYFLQGVTAVNLGLAVSAVVLRERGTSFGPRLAAVCRLLEENAFVLGAGCAATLVCVAFYEAFPPALPVGMACFQCLWLAALPAVRPRRRPPPPRG
ncbi:MAG: hypothetical protein ISN26_04990 [Betaproteobacteria bacterium AqS2]|uniref:Uncharacterized protein n=1 Tax=Candidatus Amphirhobacter heronislandensis TaxID=1732024 RepID=A0A930UFE8_9GAMM|nr:hypothetical protein [Betaproteobacteria bacterium AqS2]